MWLTRPLCLQVSLPSSSCVSLRTYLLILRSNFKVTFLRKSACPGMVSSDLYFCNFLCFCLFSLLDSKFFKSRDYSHTIVVPAYSIERGSTNIFNE